MSVPQIKCRQLSFHLALMAVLVCPAVLSAQIVLTHTHAFGDSLTKNDQIHYLFLGKSYQDYGMDPIEGFFKRLSQKGDKLVCWAELGATSDAILKQVEKYDQERKTGKTQEGTFFSLEAGANDLLTAKYLKRLAENGPGKNAKADEIVDRIVANIRQSIKILKKSRNATIVVWTVPDITLTPMLKQDMHRLDLNKEQFHNVRLHTQRLNSEIKKMQHEYQVAILDTHAILNRLVANATMKRMSCFSNTLVSHASVVATFHFPAFSLMSILNDMTQKSSLQKQPIKLFVDPIHPTAKVNALLSRDLQVLLTKRQGRRHEPTFQSNSNLLANAK